MSDIYYLCFAINSVPDLTLAKYRAFDGSSVDDVMDKHGVFLRQLHRLGTESSVFFHLLYLYVPSDSVENGKHLTILLYATSSKPEALEGVREFVNTSVLSTYYDFYCYEIVKNITISKEAINGETHTFVSYNPYTKNDPDRIKKYMICGDSEYAKKMEREIRLSDSDFGVFEVAPDANAVLSYNSVPVDDHGRLLLNHSFGYAAYLTKKDYFLLAQNRLPEDKQGEVKLFSIMEWEPCEDGRLYNALKLMEGYDRFAALRVDLYPIEHTHQLRESLPYSEIRRRISDRNQGKDDNSETIVRSWDKYISNLLKYPQFMANIVAFADSKDIAVMLADSVAAEAVESGTYSVFCKSSGEGFDIYHSDMEVIPPMNTEPENYVSRFLSLYTLDEIRPMFSLPILYPGETIQCRKETDPLPLDGNGKYKSFIDLGYSSNGYRVAFPVKLLDRHAFIAGVPGSGKTNTMLRIITSLWKDKAPENRTPFLVLEPAKQEYRVLALMDGMEDMMIFSPGADTKFPLHINPFEFPIGLTLAEHIANLNSVFAGAFELIPPSPFLIDKCIERVYIDKGWNTNERNHGNHEYPTLQELYDSLKVAVEESGYEGESKSNIRSVMEVRIGSLLRREIGNVYNVRQSIIKPEEWLDIPAVIELEALGEGPANFMSLLITTLIREALKVRKNSDPEHTREINHVIFYEEAHNLIGPSTDDPLGGGVDPKISATKYLVKMLAEVRALKEGIVIADQLPTAMAPEVLKNTGLKIGHRITATDDRNVLGGTMSASSSQLEEQGIFEQGTALIFYEGLQKPYKMKINKWQQTHGNLEPPTNEELSKLLKDNPRYIWQLQVSEAIIIEKMNTEYNALKAKSVELLKTATGCESESAHCNDSKKRFETELAKYTKGSSEYIGYLADIKTIDNKLLEINNRLAKLSDITLKPLCRDYGNLYYSYITLSENYNASQGNILISAISNYMNLFSILDSLRCNKTLLKVLLDETASVIDDISGYIDIDNLGQNTSALSTDDRYPLVITECSYYTKRIMCAKFSELIDKTVCAKSEQEVTNVCQNFSSLFSRYYHIAKRHSDNTDTACSVIDKMMSCAHDRQIDILLRCRDKYICQKKSLYLELVIFSAQVFNILSVHIRQYHSVIARETLELRKAISTIVDYRHTGAGAILENWHSDNYVINKGFACIIRLELEEQFSRIRAWFDEAASAFIQNGTDVDDMLTNVFRDINSFFFNQANRYSDNPLVVSRLVELSANLIHLILDEDEAIVGLFRSTPSIRQLIGRIEKTVSENSKALPYDLIKFSEKVIGRFKQPV